ncbi:MAG TPA: LytTR family DNA-binding domain-containing protein [Flavipsychrobacter sp.]
MSDYKCVIIDDEPKAIELLVSRLKVLFPNIQVAGTFTDWGSGLECVRAGGFDILFLDVSMPEKTGIDFLKLFPAINFQVIFITAHSEFALQAIKFSAAGYVLKPIDDYELSFAINKAIENIGNKAPKVAEVNGNGQSKDILKIGIPNTKGIDYLNADDILYFESVNKYTKVVTNSYSIISSYNVGEFKKIIDPETFFQVHRSYIVNLYHIKRYETSGTLVMDDNMQIPVSKTIKNEFMVEFSRISRTAGLKK